MVVFKGNKFKYTESELRDRGCGKIIYSHEQSWRMKKATYTNEGVWVSFSTLRDSFRALLKDADDWNDPDRAHVCATTMMDAFLIRRSRGKNVSVPREVVPINAVPDSSESGTALVDSGRFKDGGASENEKLRWIFENMQVLDVRPENAPSAGAWALLTELRKNDEQRRDFYKTLWPKLLTKEDAEGGGRLMDDGKPIIELIERLQAALPEVK